MLLALAALAPPVARARGAATQPATRPTPQSLLSPIVVVARALPGGAATQPAPTPAATRAARFAAVGWRFEVRRSLRGIDLTGEQITVLVAVSVRFDVGRDYLLHIKLLGYPSPGAVEGFCTDGVLATPAAVAQAAEEIAAAGGAVEPGQRLWACNLSLWGGDGVIFDVRADGSFIWQVWQSDRGGTPRVMEDRSGRGTEDQTEQLIQSFERAEPSRAIGASEFGGVIAWRDAAGQTHAKPYNPTGEQTLWTSIERIAREQGKPHPPAIPPAGPSTRPREQGSGP